ncbi:MAG: M1 family metallopeptidase, partial [Bacteroidetes bacterium]|nr:M1 family metallopeptidase [Bacteroidota bacterium]
MNKALLIFLCNLGLGNTLITLAQNSNLQDSLNNKPYFQQEVNYDIQVSLDDRAHMLRAVVDFEYINKSPDTLSFIWIHLWPNAYRNNETAFAQQELRIGTVKFQIASEEKRGFIDSLEFKVNESPVEYSYHPEHIDICKINLPEKLLPGQRVHISTPFRVKIPSSEFSRLGHVNQQYQLCQWYPKPAVYDKYGWHPIPYLNSGEFYSEFGSFRVAITVPSNYVVASSGVLQQNAEEQAFIAQRKAETLQMIEKGFPARDTFPPTAETNKTVIYTLENAHDFAWFADKRYHILESSVTLASGKVIETASYFSNINASNWTHSVEYVNDAVKHYSELVGEYPYPVCKSVDGALSAGAGMEYPTITVISGGSGEKSLDNVTAHEVGHNWFYGILASNERDYPWMDEGMNSYYESVYMKRKYNNASMLGNIQNTGIGRIFHMNDLRESDLTTVPYLLQARRNLDQALNLTSDNYSQGNYGIIVYQKTSYIMHYLEGWLGTKKFNEMMQAYYNKWKFRHPYPEDFKAHVQEFTGQQLDWFFDDLLTTRKRVDYKVKKVSSKPDNYFVKVKNKGGVESPVSITGVKGDSTITFWYDGFSGTSKLSFPTAGFNKFVINYSGEMTDVDIRNNRIKSRGLFKSGRKPVIGLISGIDNPNKAQLYVLPTLGYNYYNEFMTGVAIHNIGILRKKFEFVVNPMYSFGRDALAGAAQTDYFIMPTNAFFNNITITASAEQFATRNTAATQRLTGGLRMNFINSKRANKKDIFLEFKHIFVRQDYYILSPGEAHKIGEEDYNLLRFRKADNRLMNPYSVDLEVQHGMRFAKASVTAEYKFSYNNPKKGLRLRFFAGTFLWKSNLLATSGQDVRFRLSGQTGSQDYL